MDITPMPWMLIIWEKAERARVVLVRGSGAKEGCGMARVEKAMVAIIAVVLITWREIAISPANAIFAVVKGIWQPNAQKRAKEKAKATSTVHAIIVANGATEPQIAEAKAKEKVPMALRKRSPMTTVADLAH